jgi:protein-S-isoprenylcysteine O-methyltransferase Ste14
VSEVSEALARKRVPLGFVCGATVLWLAHPTVRTLALGVSIASAGELLRIWAAGHLEKGREVTRSGPYRLVRHPLYIGSAIIGVGFAIAGARLSVAVLIAVYLTITTLSAVRTEEAAMRAAFGEQYDAYSKSSATPIDRRFSITRAIRNKEHRAIAGLLAVAAILAIKIVFGSS